MDSRSAFGVILVLLGFAGLWALVTGRLSIANGTISIGAPTTTTAAGTSSTAGQMDTTNTGSANYASVSGTPTATQVASILGTAPTAASLASFYSAGQPTELTSTLAGDGYALTPYSAYTSVG